MNWPKNATAFKRGGDIEKKTNRQNFYSRPDVCNLDAYLDPTLSRIFRNKGGISPTIQGIMRVKASSKDLFELTGGKMFMKSFPEAVGRSRGGRPDASLLMEVYILRYLSYFSVLRISPCIQQYYMDFVCSPDNKGIAREVQNEYSNLKTAFFDEPEFDPPKAPIRYVMTELIEGKELKESVGSLSEQDMKHVLFQVFYTTNEMHTAGVRHNDLHDGNVLLVPIKPTDLYFVTKQGTVFLEKCRYIAKIIDYDRATFYEKRDWILESQKISQFNGLCKAIGSCAEGPNPKRDQIILISFLVDAMIRNGIKNSFVERLINKLSSDPTEMIVKPVSRYKSGWKGHLCHNPHFIEGLGVGDYRNQGMCANWIPSDSLFITFDKMIKNNVFELKVIPSTDYTALPQSTTWVSLEVDDQIRGVMAGIQRTIRDVKKVDEVKPLPVPDRVLPMESKPVPMPAIPAMRAGIYKPALIPNRVSGDPSPRANPLPIPKRGANLRRIPPPAPEPVQKQKTPPAPAPVPAQRKTPPAPAPVQRQKTPPAPVDDDAMDWEPIVYPEKPKSKTPQAPVKDDPMDWEYIVPRAYVDDDPMDWE